MKKILLCVLSLVLMLSVSGCKKHHDWTGTYELTYFYLEDCSNCQHFRDNVLPAIEEEFGDHIVIKAYDMDTETDFVDMKAAYDGHLKTLTNWDDKWYGFGPLVFLEGYVAILGAGNADEYVQHLICAIEDGKMDEPDETIESFYYIKDGKVKE